MEKRHWLTFVIAALACCGESGCNADAVDIQGAGATFPAPLYKRWFVEYYQQHPEVRVNYQAIGSGAGIRQFSSKLADFGASDAAMSDAEIKKAMEANPAGEGVLMLPVTAGSIAICYNAPGAPADVKLSRQVYVAIFCGTITNWNDPAIAAVNPGVTFPDLPITVVRRADSSGTTFVFSKHLAKISKGEFEKQLGKPGKSVQWPETFIGGKGNAGVAALIQQTPGAIGYLEYGYAKILEMPTASLENKKGNYVAPSLEAGQAALADVKMPENMVLWNTDPAAAKAYPIVTYTWLLCWKNYGDDANKSQRLKEMLRYCLTEGQEFSADLGYIPLSPEVAKAVLKAVDQIKP